MRLLRCQPKFSIAVFLLVATSLALWAECASARVFNFQSQNLTTYLRGTYGLTQLGNSAFAPAFPPAISFPSGGSTQDYSGEFGFGFTVPAVMTIRIGAELLSAQQLTQVPGAISGTQVGSVDSQVYSVIPQGNFEFFIKKSATSRFYVGGGLGYAVTTVKNTVDMAAGSGFNDFIEEGTGWGFMGQAFTGYEFSFFDNVSFSLDLGYRYLFVNNLTSNRESITPNGTITPGASLTNNDGTNRTLNLSGPWAGATFRFWIK